MKIVYCIPSVYNSGGMERILSVKTSWLVAHGHDVTIVTTDNKARPPFFHFDPSIRFIDLAINYSDHIHNFITKLFKSPFLLTRHKIRLNKVLTTLRPDITISMFNAESTFLWKLGDGSKKIVEVHFARSFRFKEERGGLWLLYNRWRSAYDLKCVRHYDRFVVLSHADALAWPGLSNIEVIYNPVSFESTSVALLETPKALAVGRFAYQKGFDLLIDIWSRIHYLYPDWTLDIYGDGTEKQARAEQILQLGLQDTIKLHPASTNLPEVMLNYSVFCFPSRYEGFGLVLAEAMECGIPCVSFDCPSGPSEIIRDGEDGFLVPLGRDDVFAERLGELIRNSSLRKEMGKRAKNNIRRFSIDTIMKQWEALFENLLR